MRTILAVLSATVLASATAFPQSRDTVFNQTDAGGLRQGYWKATYDNGKLKYKGYFKDGKPLGLFVRYYEDGTRKAVMNYEPDGATVEVAFYYQDDSLGARGKYVNQNKTGDWEFYSYYTHTLTCKETYIDGKKEGLSIKYYPSHIISEELEYHHDMKQGKWNQYYENGAPRLVGHYINNLRQGDYKVLYPSGLPQVKGAFLNDKMDGKWTYYNEDGKVDLEIEYANGNALHPEKLDERSQALFKFIEENKGKYPEPDETNFLNPVK